MFPELEALFQNSSLLHPSLQGPQRTRDRIYFSNLRLFTNKFMSLQGREKINIFIRSILGANLTHKCYFYFSFTCSFPRLCGGTDPALLENWELRGGEVEVPTTQTKGSILLSSHHIFCQNKKINQQFSSTIKIAVGSQ